MGTGMRIVQWICRTQDYRTRHLLELEDIRRNVLEVVCNNYYKQNPNVVRNQLIFAVDENNEWFWKFEHCGWPETWFPFDRLPEDLEEELRKFMPSQVRT